MCLRLDTCQGLQKCMDMAGLSVLLNQHLHSMDGLVTRGSVHVNHSICRERKPSASYISIVPRTACAFEPSSALHH